MTHTTSGLPSIPHQEDGEYVDILNDSLKGFFKDALRVALRSPAQAYFFLRTVWWQRKAVRLRAKWAQESVHVPPILIFSVTNRCNLQCKGCYHQALHRSSQAEMSADKLRSIVEEADQLGISFVVLAGGEPLVRREILDITVDFPQIVFLMFTNGLLLEDGLLSKLRKQRNVVPVVSLEGLRRRYGPAKRQRSIWASAQHNRKTEEQRHILRNFSDAYDVHLHHPDGRGIRA